MELNRAGGAVSLPTEAGVIARIERTLAWDDRRRGGRDFCLSTKARLRAASTMLTAHPAGRRTRSPGPPRDLRDNPSTSRKRWALSPTSRALAAPGSKPPRASRPTASTTPSPTHAMHWARARATSTSARTGNAPTTTSNTPNETLVSASTAGTRTRSTSAFEPPAAAQFRLYRQRGDRRRRPSHLSPSDSLDPRGHSASAPRASEPTDQALDWVEGQQCTRFQRSSAFPMLDRPSLDGSADAQSSRAGIRGLVLSR